MYKGNRMISFVGTIEFDNKTVNIGDLELEMDNSSEIYYTIKHCMNDHFKGCPLEIFPYNLAPRHKLGWVNRIYTIGGNMKYVIFDLYVDDDFDLKYEEWFTHICIRVGIKNSDRTNSDYPSEYYIESVYVKIMDENIKADTKIYFEFDAEEDLSRFVTIKLSEANETLRYRETPEITDDILTQAIELIDRDWIEGSDGISVLIRVPSSDSDLIGFDNAIRILSTQSGTIKDNPFMTCIPLLFNDRANQELYIAGHATSPYVSGNFLFYQINAKLNIDTTLNCIQNHIFQEADGDYILADRVNCIQVVTDEKKKEVICYCVDISSKDFEDENDDCED